MRVMVLGAGVIGTSCAYQHDKAAHDEVVLDRQRGPALETSFANAGGICPGFAGPWAAPGMPARVARWLFGHHRPIVLHPRLDPYQWRWLLLFLRNCTPERFARIGVTVAGMENYCLAGVLAASAGGLAPGRLPGTSFG